MQNTNELISLFYIGCITKITFPESWHYLHLYWLGVKLYRNRTFFKLSFYIGVKWFPVEACCHAVDTSCRMNTVEELLKMICQKQFNHSMWTNYRTRERTISLLFSVESQHQKRSSIVSTNALSESCWNSKTYTLLRLSVDVLLLLLLEWQFCSFVWFF